MATVNADGSIVLTTQVDASGALRGIDSLRNGVKKAGAIMGAAFGTAKLVAYGKTAFQTAAKAEAAAGRIQSVFKSAQNTVLNFINSNSASMGMSQTQAAELAAAYGNLFSVWADENTAAELTLNLLKATAAAASHTGRTIDDVGERFRSGLLGNTEAVEDLGVFVNLKTLEMSRSFARIADGRPWAQLSAHEQAQVRSLAVLEQASDKFGAEVAVNAAFVKSSLSAAVSDFSAAWGSVLNSVLVPILSCLTRIFQTAAAVIRLLSGYGASAASASASTAGTALGAGSKNEAGNVAAGDGAGGSGSGKSGSSSSAKSGSSGKSENSAKSGGSVKARSAAGTASAGAGSGAATDSANTRSNVSSDMSNTRSNLNRKTVNKRSDMNLKTANVRSDTNFKTANTRLGSGAASASIAAKKASSSASAAKKTSASTSGETMDLGLPAVLVNGEYLPDFSAVSDLATANVVAANAADVASQKQRLLTDSVADTQKAADGLLASFDDLTVLSAGQVAGEIGGYGDGNGDGLFALGDGYALGADSYGSGIGGIGLGVGSGSGGYGLDLGADFDGIGSGLGVGSGVGVGSGGEFDGLFDFGIDKINSDSDQIQAAAVRIAGALEEITATVAVSLSAVGLVLLACGQLGSGVAFVLAGAYLFGVSDSAAGGGSSSGSGSGAGSGGAGSGGVLSAISSDVGNAISAVNRHISGALAAVGVILLACGCLGAGVAFVLAGAAAFGLKYNGSGSGAAGGLGLGSGGELGVAANSVGDALSSIMQSVSVSLTAIGILLIFYGFAGVGIGFILLGAKAAGISSQNLSESGVQTKIGRFFDECSSYVVGAGLGLLALGVIIIACGGVTPLGLGILCTGAAALKLTAETNGEDVGSVVGSFITENLGLFMGVASALCVLGIVLLACGVSLPLGLGLLAVGGGALAAAAAPNFGYISESVSSFISNNFSVIAGVGAALCVLGIILIMSGVGLPIGLGLLAAGGCTLAAAVAPNFSLITEKLAAAWGAVKEFWTKNVAPIFTAVWWEKLGKTCVNGLIAGIEGGINGIIAAFESMINYVVSGLNRISLEIPDWVPEVGGLTFGFNIPKAKFGRVKIPRLAAGAVIPANREFLAVLGDQKSGVNVEAPALLIKKMASEAISEAGLGDFAAAMSSGVSSGVASALSAGISSALSAAMSSEISSAVASGVASALSDSLSSASSGRVLREEHFHLGGAELMSVIYRLARGGERICGASLID